MNTPLMCRLLLSSVGVVIDAGDDVLEGATLTDPAVREGMEGE